MYTIIWVILTLAFLVSIIAIVPSLMALGSPTLDNKTLYLKILKTNFYLIIFYPIAFIASILISLILNINTTYFLLPYLCIILIIIASWIISENRKKNY